MAARLWIALAAVLLAGTGAAWAASAPAVEAENGMVVSSQALASRVGADILAAGGNAVDAAVAVAFAEAVVNPCCGNLGGGGFLLLHTADGQSRFVNFREKAPEAASQDMYLDGAGNVVKGASLRGWKAAGVPGTVLGLTTALARYGTLPLARVVAPAVGLARDGFVLTRGDTDILATGTRRFARDPAIARIFLRPDGTPFQPGDRLVQADLAGTLEAIAKGGADAFYKGDIPRAVEAASRAGGGLLTAADFSAYTVTEEAPLTCTYRGATILAAPPPSSGGTTLCEMLTILDGYDIAGAGFNSARSVHLMVEAMRRAYADRNATLGDPAFVKNPVATLISPDYAARMRATIRPDRATPSAEVRPDPSLLPEEKRETTHISVLDKAGNAVSLTYTINGYFGAGVMAPGTGFFLNNEMDDFTVKVGTPNLFGLVQGTANAIAPGKRPLSSMAPTLVLREGKPVMVVGSPGGSRIITINAQTIMNMLDFGMQPQEAVDAPRIHHQWLPDTVYAEPFALSADTLAILKGMGHAVQVQTPWGAQELIAVRGAAPTGEGPDSSGNDSSRTEGMRPGLIYGANDNRRPAGAAIGH
ncbi:gamma-glutamyltransferase [Methylobacterium aerolatum]|uniref:Glutathione hydrolase proenzyme n=1 Tax=Methylobacterium aerolatum TaxID=418708 RepID=A0ABU0I4G9_9HYPH|nr:gamma-glutamyltransferase [Methylobacterium aerolatum]MDQ0448544.1 gamma-glutamyltranspeptidase/glutathione hydrolase [Methylobacterium aerolatum]GJD33161.1 Glutathione hydrolase proenzyme [Methylobacterium aerolatum]